MNPFEQTSRCVERLFNEYKKHPRLVISTDFDDSVFNFHQYPDTSYERIISALQACKRLNFFVVCFTASPVSRYDFIREHFKSVIGIEIDGINENVIDTPYGKNGKIFYNIHLDDRCGLGQATDILETLIQKIQNETNTLTTK